jgi:predicted transcriptional regulator of viral defense system
MMDFFQTHTVFTVGEFKSHHSSREKAKGARSADSLLAYHVKSGRLLNIKRGLYAVVPSGLDPGKYTPDPFLLASRMSSDAVLSHHTALEFHGRAYSVFSKFTYQTSKAPKPVTFRGMSFQPVRTPGALERQNKEHFGVKTHDLKGRKVKVTSFERTLVDVMDRPKYSGSWEEKWRSLETVEFFNLDQVVEYVQLLGNATTAAKVGFYLEQHREELMVPESYLDELKQLCPKQPHYLERKRNKKSSWVASWNLMVPDEIIGRTWEEGL